MSEVLKIINEIPKAIILITTSIIFAKILLEDKKIKLDKKKDNGNNNIHNII